VQGNSQSFYGAYYQSANHFIATTQSQVFPNNEETFLIYRGFSSLSPELGINPDSR